MNWRHRITAFLSKSTTAKCSLMICILSITMWVYSSGVYYQPLEPLTVACRIPGVLFQTCSHRGAIHFLVMHTSWHADSTFGFERRSYLGNAGYSHGAVSTLGFALSFLPTTFNDGDCSMSPHLAIAIPHWFIAGASGFIFLRWLYFRNLKQQPRQLNNSFAP